MCITIYAQENKSETFDYLRKEEVYSCQFDSIINNTEFRIVEKYYNEFKEYENYYKDPDARIIFYTNMESGEVTYEGYISFKPIEKLYLGISYRIGFNNIRSDQSRNVEKFINYFENILPLIKKHTKCTYKI